MTEKLDREALIEKAAQAIKPGFVSAGLVDLDAEDYAWDAARAALAVFEEAHTPTDDERGGVNVTPEGIEVKPGQRWRSLDKRDNGRTVLVLAVQDGKARVTTGVTRSTISVRRMRRMSTGWELVG